MAREVFCQILFKVEGSGLFPYSMLSMDRCCPVTYQDGEKLPQEGPRAIWLSRFTTAGKAGPSVEEWARLGWVVVPESIRFR